MASLAVACPSPFSSSCSSCYPNTSSRNEVKITGNGVQDGFHASILITPLSFRSRSHSKCLRRRTGVRCQPSPLRVVCLHDSNTPGVTRWTWDDTVLKSECPVLVEFYAKWCGPCQMVHRVIDEIAREYRGKLKCFVLDTDDNLKVAETYDIKAVPVVLLFKNGVKRGTIVGTMPKEFYVAAIEEVLAP